MLLLEAGRPDTAAEVHVPAMFPLAFKSSLDWDLYGEPEPGLGGRRLYLPRGRVIGGSSSINAMIYLRGNRADFDEWAADGCDGLVVRRGAAVLQALRGQRARRERVPRRRRPAHRVRQPLDEPVHRRAARGCRRRPATSTSTTSTSTGRRASRASSSRSATACAAAPPTRSSTRPRERPNLEVTTGVFVERIVFEGDRAVGVELVPNGVREIVRAEREVIVSAGAYQSPVLLMLSGIGPADELAPFGIAVRQDLPVGHNLQDHCMVNVNYLTDRPGLLRHLHARELRAPRERGPRAAHLELPGGGRLLPHPLGPAGAGRRVPLRRGALLRRGPDAAARQRLRVRAGDHQAHVARQGRAAHADARLEADACCATS